MNLIKHGLRTAAALTAAGVVALAGTAPSAAQDRVSPRDESVPPAQEVDTRCGVIDVDLEICISTGPGVPTTAWLTNNSGLTYFGVVLRIYAADGSFRRDGVPFTSHAHSGSIGMELHGLADNCYYGSVNLGGPGWHRTPVPACV